MVEAPNSTQPSSRGEDSTGTLLAGIAELGLAHGGDSADTLAGIAELDLARAERRGFPEAVYCQSKTIPQLRLIARAYRDQAPALPLLFTRADPAQAAAIAQELPGTAYHELARLAWWPAAEPEPSGGRVLVLTAGTSDLPVAQEACLTARLLGRDCQLIADVGVAGLHRLLGHLDELRLADVIIVVAGMDGALASVVAGLVAAPVIAVPTSVGYGAAFEGLAALLAMLNACAPGVAVVNIDNGYGAGHLAAQISRR